VLERLPSRSTPQIRELERAFELRITGV